MQYKAHIPMMVATGAILGFAAFSHSGPTKASAGGGGCHGAPENQGTGTEVTIKNCFSPTVLRVEPGERVTFRNTDEYVHNVGGQTWSIPGTMAGLSSAEVTFAKAGTFPYACTLHPGMVGVVIVGDSVGQMGASQIQSSTVRLDSIPQPSAVAESAVSSSAENSDGPDVAWLASVLVSAAAAAVAAGTASFAAVRRGQRRSS